MLTIRTTTFSPNDCSLGANDGASGVLQFTEDSRHITLHESDGDDVTMTSQQTSYNLMVERMRGRYGVVEVAWMVLNATHNGHGADVQPTSGTLRFGNLDFQKSFQVKTVDDQVPELEKVLKVQLQIVSGEKKCCWYGGGREEE